MKSLRIAAIATAAAATALGTAVMGTSTASATLPATKVTTANLPATSQMRVPGARVSVDSTTSGANQFAMTKCQNHDWADYKPNAEFSRVYTAQVPGAHGVTFSAASIASFSTHAAAVKAASSMASSFTCSATARQTDGYLSDSARTTTRTVTLKGGQVVHLALLTYDTSVNRQVDTVENVAVVATGTHVELLSLGYFASMGTATSAPALASIQATLPTLAK